MATGPGRLMRKSKSRLTFMEIYLHSGGPIREKCGCAAVQPGCRRKVEVEQAHVYGLLDKHVADVRAHVDDVRKSSADSAGEVYARDVAAERLARQVH